MALGFTQLAAIWNYLLFLSLATVWLNLEAINPLSFDNAQVDDMPLAVGNDWAYFHVD